uniref:Uncharacterized protein n=1 Tax=Anguilla anguilla TaxID=7936 RepID=A0A0E9R0Y5_ANGAN
MEAGKTPRLPPNGRRCQLLMIKTSLYLSQLRESTRKLSAETS